MKSESETRQTIIDKKLNEAGWDVKNLSQVSQKFDIAVPLPEGVAEARSPYEGHQFSDYVLLSRDGKPMAVVEAKKTSKDPTYFSIGQIDIENFKLPMLAIDDQIRIATILTRAENLIAKRKASIKALDEFLKSTFLEMFGDPLKNEKGWEEKVILDGCKNKNDIKCGPFGIQLSKSEFKKKQCTTLGYSSN